MIRQDCRNIGRKLHDFRQHCHNDDAISVDRIVEELHNESQPPVQLYKAQGVPDPENQLPADTFLLVITTNFQAQLFHTFSHKIVCLDSTHRTNQYRFKLITLMVADEFRNGELEMQLYNYCATLSALASLINRMSCSMDD